MALPDAPHLVITFATALLVRITTLPGAVRVDGKVPEEEKDLEDSSGTTETSWRER